MTLAVRPWLAAVALAGLAVAAEPADDTPPQTAPYVLPPAGFPVVQFLRPDPLLDRPDAPPPGPFFDVETRLVAVHLRNQPSNFVALPDGSTDALRFGGNALDDSVSPRFELGWRLADGWGDLRFSYRFLATSGSNQTPSLRILTDANGNTTLTDLGNAHQGGRFDLNVADFAYWSREFSLDEQWEMRWGVGARMAFVYFDSHFTVDSPGAGQGSVLSQGMSSTTRAYGGFAALDLSYRTAVPGLAVFGRLDAGQLFGRVKQIYNEQLTGGGPLPLSTRNDGSVGLPMLDAQVGLSYTVPGWNKSRFLIGYEQEVWWQVGRLNDARGQLEDYGLFLRAEINY
jgi:hypothetical protein